MTKGWFNDPEKHKMASYGLKSKISQTKNNPQTTKEYKNYIKEELKDKDIEESAEWIKSITRSIETEEDYEIYTDIWSDLILLAQEGNDKAKNVLHHFTREKNLEGSSEIFYKYSDYDKEFYERGDIKVNFMHPKDNLKMEKEKSAELAMKNIFDFLYERNPDLNLHVNISDKPIDITSVGSDSIRVSIPPDESVEVMFPYDDWTYNQMIKWESFGVPSRVLWATGSIFHELAHTQGVRKEEKADKWSLELFNMYLDDRHKWIERNFDSEIYYPKEEMSKS